MEGELKGEASFLGNRAAAKYSACGVMERRFCWGWGTAVSQNGRCQLNSMGRLRREMKKKIKNFHQSETNTGNDILTFEATVASKKPRMSDLTSDLNFMAQTMLPCLFRMFWPFFELC